MTITQINEPDKKVTSQFALFALGFRPFFLLAGFSAIFLLGLWVIAFSQGWQIPTHIPAVYWHSHEMIFGYSAAVIAGFLLTAVRNWTGVSTLSGKSLMALSLLWLAARILPFTATDLIIVSIIDTSFLFFLALAIAYPIIKVKQWKNLFFVPLLLLYAVANGLFYAELILGLEGAEEWAIHGGLGVVITLITIMAGRVVGFFIERGISTKVTTYRSAEFMALTGTILFMAGQFFLPTTLLTILAMIAALGHLGRLHGWYNAEIWQVPLLWVLYLGYIWLLIGFVLTALEINNVIAETLAIHAFTTGTIGIMTLGMMARVALGHTGRPMQTSTVMTGCFILINLSAIVRVVLPLLLPDMYINWVQIAGLLWVVAFTIFVLVYTHILVKTRIDGMPG